MKKKIKIERVNKEQVLGFMRMCMHMCDFTVCLFLYYAERLQQ